MGRGRSKQKGRNDMSGSGTSEDPWVLKTPPGTSEFTIYRDDTAEPAELVCQVGSTKLRYLARCLDDVPAMLKTHGDWMELGSADEGSRRRTGRWRPGGVRTATRSEAGTACARGTGVASRCTSRRCWRSSAWSNSNTILATTASAFPDNESGHSVDGSCSGARSFAIKVMNWRRCALVRGSRTCS